VDDEPEEFVSLLAFPSALLAVWSLGEGFLDRGLVHPLVDLRPVGPFGNPNYLGGLLALLTVMHLSLAAVRRASGGRVLPPLAIAAVCLAATSTTLSRGAFLGMAAGLALLALRTVRRGRVVLVVVFTVTLVGVIGPVVYGTIVRERASASDVAQVLGTQAAYQADEYATQVREEAARLALGYAVQHPWTGIGLDRFAAQAELDPTFLIEFNTHNEPLRIAAEVGLVALGLLVLFLGIVVGKVRRRSRSVATLALPAMVCYGATNLFLNGFEYLTLTFPVVAVVFLAVGRPDTMRAGATRRVDSLR
jgi:O-antigen ligase